MTMTPRAAMLIGAPLLLLLAAAAPAADVPLGGPRRLRAGAGGRPHATLMPFDSVEEALASDRKASARCLLLSGTWKFHWAPVPGEAPERVLRAGLRRRRAGTTSRCRAAGRCRASGTRCSATSQHPFPSDPAARARGRQPGGVLPADVRSCPRAWQGRQVFLHFEGVKSASYVWVNGQEVGYNQGGMEPAEYDVTRTSGRARTPSRCASTATPTAPTSKTRTCGGLAGIYRDVYLMATPRVHVRDFFVTTDLDEDYRDAELRDRGGGQPTTARETVAGYRLRATRLPVTTATPVQRALRERAVSIAAGARVGIRLSARRRVAAPVVGREAAPLPPGPRAGGPGRRGGRDPRRPGGLPRDGGPRPGLLVNGRPVKLNAVNSHVHHPDTGRAMDVGHHADRTSSLMKRFNVNAVRTSHYPPNVGVPRPGRRARAST